MKEKIEFWGKGLLIRERIMGGKETKILAIGDLHLGYDQSLRDSGVLVPAGTFKQIKKDLEITLENINGAPNNELDEKKTKIDKIIILGDLKHEFGKILRDEWKEVLELIDFLSENAKEIIIIKGNHDVIISPILKKKKVSVRDFYIWKGFCFLHGDKDFREIHDKKIGAWVIGHGHPAIKLEDNIKSEKYKCFLTGKFGGRAVFILPSLFPVFEGTDPRDFDLGFPWKFNLNNFRVKIVGESFEVLDFGRLGKIKSN